MRKSRRPIRIAARRSVLAQRQAQIVGSVLQQLNKHVAVEFNWLACEADDDYVSSGGTAPDTIASIGKGRFVREVERSVLTGESDIAVHSIKDLPAAEASDGLTIAAIPRRADARDCLIARGGPTSIADLDPRARVGTSSPRRGAQILRLRDDLVVIPIRGNIDTRVDKVVNRGDYDATLLAVAGLERAGMSEHAQNVIEPAQMLPAPGQGALAVQCRVDDHVSIRRCLPINDPTTATAVHAERCVVAGLDGDCNAPIAAFVMPVEQDGLMGYRFSVRVMSFDGRRCLEIDEHVDASDLGKRTKQIIERLLDDGAAAILSDQPDREVPPPERRASPD